ncbi:MAG: carboxypeptidase-like regulatory domain-containing protein [Acidobacteriota bacterium]|nr:carboxypeptidase-like regulatory domain-containing protein [Acidobacteriota bacterium]
MMHRNRWIIVLAAVCVGYYATGLPGYLRADAEPSVAQNSADTQPSSNPQQPSNSGTAQSSTSPAMVRGANNSSNHKNKNSHANDLLIRGTVFNEKALSLPGAKLVVRRAGEKKSRGETYSNSRGEFAMRLPQGAHYEIAVEMKGFARQTRAIDAKDGKADEKLIFRMEPVSRGKK